MIGMQNPSIYLLAWKFLPLLVGNYLISMLNTSQHHKCKHIHGMLSITAENDFDIVTPTWFLFVFTK